MFVFVRRAATRNEDGSDPCEAKQTEDTKKEVRMFCRSCGAQLADKAVQCPKCGTAVVVKPIPTHMVDAILATIFCCLPFGIPAIVYAAQVNSRIAAGDLEGAMRASKNANKWVHISVWIALLLGLLSAIIRFLGNAA